MIKKSPRPGGRYSGWPIVCKVFDAQVGIQLAFMGSLTAFMFATLPVATAFGPVLLTMLALTAVVVGMGLLARFYGDRAGHQAGHLAKRSAGDLIPARVLIASHEPSLRSITGRGAAAPSRAPPTHRQLLRLRRMA